MYRPNYYGGQRGRPSERLLAITEAPPQIATKPVNFIPPIQGNTVNAPPWYTQVGNIFSMRNTGLTYHHIGRGVYFQYLPAWTPTAAIGNYAVLTGFAIGVSAIFVRKQYHELIYYVGGIDSEIPWGTNLGNIFTLDQSLLDGPAVMI